MIITIFIKYIFYYIDKITINIHPHSEWVFIVPLRFAAFLRKIFLYGNTLIYSLNYQYILLGKLYHLEVTYEIVGFKFKVVYFFDKIPIAFIWVKAL